MKHTLYRYVIIFFSPTFLLGQEVTLSKIAHYSENRDKVFCRVFPENKDSEYLGEIEVAGVSNNPEETFSLIYKKAKQIGANSFSLKKRQNIDGTEFEFNEQHYYLNLYYTESKNMPLENGAIYIIASENKPQKISINNKNIDLLPKSYVKLKPQQSETYTISTRKILGSTIKVSTSPKDLVQYFQLSLFKFRQNPYGTAGINIKTGDIVTLEPSYAGFLSTIYKEVGISNR